jgi:UDP-N-acetylglucosamine 2-epimerase
LREGVPLEQIVVTGNTGVDALLYVLKKVRDGYEPLEPGVAALPPDKKLILATLHRRENIGEPLAVALRALRRLGEDGDKVIALPAHCNPEVHAQVFDGLDGAENVRLLPPLQYSDLVYLLSRAWAIVSDSGGLQEEAATFGLHILIARNTTERPEAVEAGFGRLVGANYDAIVNGVRSLTAGDKPQFVRAKNPYGRGNAAQLIARNLTAHRQRPHLAAAG